MVLQGARGILPRAVQEYSVLYLYSIQLSKPSIFLRSASVHWVSCPCWCQDQFLHIKVALLVQFSSRGFLFMMKIQDFSLNILTKIFKGGKTSDMYQYPINYIVLCLLKSELYSPPIIQVNISKRNVVSQSLCFQYHRYHWFWILRLTLPKHITQCFLLQSLGYYAFLSCWASFDNKKSIVRNRWNERTHASFERSAEQVAK